jgi:hypothetical protein
MRGKSLQSSVIGFDEEAIRSRAIWQLEDFAGELSLLGNLD